MLQSMGVGQTCCQHVHQLGQRRPECIAAFPWGPSRALSLLQVRTMLHIAPAGQDAVALCMGHPLECRAAGHCMHAHLHKAQQLL